MAHNESIRQRTIRKTGNDLMNIWTEEARVVVQWYEGGYHDDGEKNMHQLAPSAAERLAEDIEADAVADELREAAAAARHEWFELAYVESFPSLFEDR